MAFCLMILFGLIGFVLINQDTSGADTRQMKRELREERRYPPNDPLQYLLAFGIYAYYAHQPRSVRPNPWEDASRHAMIEMIRRGYTPTRCISTHDYRLLTPKDIKNLNGGLPYEKCGDGPIPGKVRLLYSLKGKNTSTWPMSPAPTTFTWFAMISSMTHRYLDSYANFIYYGFLYNRLVEWYYLVMFKDDYLRLGLDIHDVLLSEEEGLRRGEKPSAASIDRAWEELLAEIQGVVYWGDKWDEEIRGYQRLEAQRQEKAERAKEYADATSPAEQRRYDMLHGTGAYERDHVQQSAAQMIETPEWARQQLKEKYNIDY